MAQYDSIGSSYDVVESLPYRAIERNNVRLAIKPFLKSHMSVLEFGCGTGFYSSALVSWGVTHLTSMDISATMLDSAKDRLSFEISSGKVQFEKGDGAVPTSYAPDKSSSYFNMAFGAWFLNYASDKATLVSMFKNISLNLTPDGLFVGIVPHPTEDFGDRIKSHQKPPLNRLLPRNQYTEELSSGDGWTSRVFLSEDGVDFMTWHLKKSIYEEAARLGGMNGKFEWRREILPEDARERFGLTNEEWKIRVANPHLGILLVWKN
ncbi:S-adenosyl-L-methionine-dependent methyltransferase [Trichoderma evansii]